MYAANRFQCLKDFMEHLLTSLSVAHLEKNLSPESQKTNASATLLMSLIYSTLINLIFSTFKCLAQN